MQTPCNTGVRATVISVLLKCLLHGLPFSGTRREQCYSLLLYDGDSFSFYWYNYSMFYLSLGVEGNSSAVSSHLTMKVSVLLNFLFHRLPFSGTRGERFWGLLLYDDGFSFNWITYSMDYLSLGPDSEQFCGPLLYDDDRFPFYWVTYSMDYLSLGLDGSSSAVSSHMTTR